MAKTEYHEHQVGLIQYITAGMINNIKEHFLRMRSRKFLLTICIILSLMLLYRQVGLVILLLIFIAFIVDHVVEISGHYKRYKESLYLYPDGFDLEFDEFSFQRKVKNHQWERVPWSSLSLVYDNQMINNISLYQRDTKEYHLFFKKSLGEANFEKFRRTVLDKVERVL